MNLDLVTVFLDANILFPPKVRGLFIELGRERACIVRWSEDVQQEWINKALQYNRRRRAQDPGTPRETRKHLEYLKKCMNKMLPKANVRQYRAYAATVEGLKDPDDRHVVAAAVKGRVNTLITCDK